MNLGFGNAMPALQQMLGAGGAGAMNGIQPQQQPGFMQKLGQMGALMQGQQLPQFAQPGQAPAGMAGKLGQVGALMQGQAQQAPPQLGGPQMAGQPNMPQPPMPQQQQLPPAVEELYRRMRQSAPAPVNAVPGLLGR